MNIDDIVSKINPEAVEKQRKAQEEYEKRMFPLGPEEKELLKQKVSELFHNKKAKTEDLLFNLISLKQILLEEDEEAYAGWYHESVISALMTKEEKCLMKALVDADMETENLNSFPDNEEIIERGRKYQQEEEPKKKKQSLFQKLFSMGAPR